MLFRTFEPDKTKGDFINMVESKAYYQSIAEQLNKYIKETNFIGPGDDEDIGFPR